MEATILSKNVQKKSLSNKKSRIKKVKLALSNPFDLNNPILDKNDEDLIINDLKKKLEVFKIKKSNKIKVPFKLLKEVPKDQRKIYREKYRNEKQKLDDDKQNEFNTIKKHLIQGLNSVIKNIEKNAVDGVLISSDISPKQLQNHIILLCKTKNVPLLILNTLKDLTKTYLERSSMCIAFKNSEYFTSTIQLIKNIAKEKFSFIKKPTNNKPSVETLVEPDKLKVPLNSEKVKELFEAIDKLLSSNFCKKSKRDDQNKDVIDVNKYYLFRSLDKERAFVPELNKKPLSDEFIPFNNEENDIEFGKVPYLKRKNMMTEYKLAKIKKIVPNQNRKKGKTK